MARPSSSRGSSNMALKPNGALKFAGAALAVIAGGIGVGYLFGSARPARPPEQPVPTTATPLAAPPAPAASPSSLRPHTARGNWAAPNAPRITIREERPVLHRTPQATSSDAAPADTEASQEAVPAPRAPRPSRARPDEARTDSTPAPLDTNPDTTPPAVNAGPAAPADNTPPAKPKKPAAPPAASPDPDFEQLTPRGDAAPTPAAPTGAGSGHHA